MPKKAKSLVTKTKVPILEVFTNPYPQRDYTVEIETPEFTSMCPRTGQPDFGILHITYIPDKTCVELKSLKLYLQQYRNEGIFYEDLTNQVLDDLVKACSPRYIRLICQWHPRGGITTKVTAKYSKFRINKKQPIRVRAKDR